MAFHCFKQGDEVLARESTGTSWLHGVVTSVSPLEVQVNGWPIPMSFKYVRMNVGSNDAKQTGMKLLKKLGLCWLDGETVNRMYLKQHQHPATIKKRFWYHDAEVRHLSSEDGAALRIAWTAYEQENSLWCSEAPIMDIVLSYLINVNAKQSEEEDDGSDTQSFRIQYVPHVIGKRGSVINSIRRKTMADITLLDERTEFLPKDLSRHDKRMLFRGCVIKIAGTARQIRVAKSLFSAIVKRVDEYENKKRMWLRWKRRKSIKRTRCYTNSREKWVLDMWDMQKLQRGAKGDWFVSKHKHKGRDKSQKKTTGRHKRVKAIGRRKPKRSFTMEVSNRQVRLSF